jgi:hypothetical protein
MPHCSTYGELHTQMEVASTGVLSDMQGVIDGCRLQCVHSVIGALCVFCGHKRWFVDTIATW